MWHRITSFRCRRNALTIVEVLVVIAIITLIITLFFPAVQASREAGRRTQCANHLKQIGLAVQVYHSVDNELPPSYVRQDWLTWAALILPWMDQDTRRWDLQL